MKKRRLPTTVSAGSMADIAFLLLIFFLVSTQILNDKGVSLVLPEYSEKRPERGIYNGPIFKIIINGEDQIMINETITDISLLRSKVKNYVLNQDGSEENAKSPTKALITLNSTQETSYELYVKVYSELKNAYKEIWKSEGKELISKPWHQWNDNDIREIKKKYPIKISEVEKWI